MKTDLSKLDSVNEENQRVYSYESMQTNCTSGSEAEVKLHHDMINRPLSM